MPVILTAFPAVASKIDHLNYFRTKRGKVKKSKMKKKALKQAWFKRHQRDGIYNYYEVTGTASPERNYNAYQQIVSFLSDRPSISIKHNSPNDPTGTWCLWEDAEPITEGEYRQAYKRALDHPDVIIR